jgi:hypothetical protein
VLLVAAARPVNAQSTGLGVTPHRDITVSRGKSVDSSLFISNLNPKVPVKVTFSIIDFKSADETGTPALELNKDAKNTPWSLKSFITLPNTLELKAGEAKNIPFKVTIPATMSPGSYYSAIRYNAEPGEKKGVTVNASAATLVFVNVPGKATEQLNLKNFGAYDIKEGQVKGKFKSLFVTKQPQELAYLVENAGNVAEKPSGTVEIKNMFGKHVRTISDANPRSNLALIGQTRRIEFCINPEKREVTEKSIKTVIESCISPKLAPGMYKLHLHLMYGLNGSSSQEINTVATVWYVPIWSVAVLLLLLAVLAAVLVVLRVPLIRQIRRLKRGRRHHT